MNKELLNISRIKDPYILHNKITDIVNKYNISYNLLSEYSIHYPNRIGKFSRFIELDELFYFEKIMSKNQGFIYKTEYIRLILSCKLEGIKREYSIYIQL